MDTNTDLNVLEQLMERITLAQTAEELDDLKKEANLQLNAMENRIVGQFIDIQRRVQEVTARTKEVTDRNKEVTDRIKGIYFVDAHDLYRLEAPGDAGRLLDNAFTNICRSETPEFYRTLVKETTTTTTTTTTTGTRKKFSSSSIGFNTDYKPGAKDVFGNVAPIRVHVAAPYSRVCCPGWGHMTEAATGKIDDMTSQEDKNLIRCQRTMGPAAVKGGLRYHLHNFLSLPFNHSDYFDIRPQVIIIPLLDLPDIKNWKANDPYSVAVLVSSLKNGGGFSVETVYQKLMASFDWDKFESSTDDGICSPAEIKQAFALLRTFIPALVDSLR